jgi:Ca2+/H+ antiporter, TMEM165/GDT1 family
VGITVATALVHAVSVGVGALLRVSIPTRPISIIAGIGFLGFAAWTWRGDQLDDDERSRAERASGHGAVVAASTAFLLSELGDKTMLATITLATKYEAIGVWLGSTVGMVGADALAIAVGKQLGTRLPERSIRIGAALTFVVFGVLLIVEGARG